MNKKDFTKPYDEVFFVYSVLKRLGSGDIKTFEKRLKSQKVQYIAQLFNIVPNYSYNLYIHGPYSPNMANDLYIVSVKDVKLDTDKFLPEELEDRFNILKSFLKNLNNRDLELVATLHWFLCKASLGSDKAIEKLKEFKNATKKEIKSTKKNINLLWHLLKTLEN